MIDELKRQRIKSLVEQEASPPSVLRRFRRQLIAAVAIVSATAAYLFLSELL